MVVPLTQDQLCQFGIVSRQFVSRHLSIWAEKGWVATRYRRIELLDPKGLTSIFDSDLHPMMLALMSHR
ncbi:helix-turn-helix domain-containing protein [Pseudomonas aeruginosa]|uniref:helix-turn-helix domain-containing protein n=1 Tax=Pseudomonas aeruginosa TaxID=287 RepID=UPI0007398644|nr:helix-turn-helix domain-containing protein [Pseudomonas aeruginosa]ELK4796658.1 winged helix-turn-helix domain-containing protein [Pseudomonas aeruginosa]MBG4551263.1 winged helix-turn-helix domain-containing protein [Pseudomonas aeruginosa]MBG7505889.1 winged helix-turn-helix domain-containing protein [Pseudomonas aeruginosa]MBH3767371.1 winged helix-turn-helix domain-containing protein [Pseudomonas aeruginosa]MBI7355642.1 winged helix-turn-helix domain-containing protein [Pseudomonas aeru